MTFPPIIIRRDATTPTKLTETGDIVRYHGSIAEAAGMLFNVGGECSCKECDFVDWPRFTLYGTLGEPSDGFRLDHVRAQSFTNVTVSR